MYGGEGGDWIFGGTGSDVIDGGEGDDYLIGDNTHGTGDKDTFVFAQGHGNDLVALFEDGVDQIDLTAPTNITGFGNLTITAQENGVVIDLTDHGGGTIRFEQTPGGAGDIDVEDLDASDFVFFEPPVDGM